MKILKSIIRRFFFWVFSDQLEALHFYLSENKKINRKLKNMLNNIDVSVDHNLMSKSWAVISIQGQKKDFIKFIDLDNNDIRHIQEFLKKFDRKKIDASPEIYRLFNRGFF